MMSYLFATGISTYVTIVAHIYKPISAQSHLRPRGGNSAAHAGNPEWLSAAGGWRTTLDAKPFHRLTLQKMLLKGMLWKVRLLQSGRPSWPSKAVPIAMLVHGQWWYQMDPDGWILAGSRSSGSFFSSVSLVLANLVMGPLPCLKPSSLLCHRLQEADWKNQCPTSLSA